MTTNRTEIQAHILKYIHYVLCDDNIDRYTFCMRYETINPTFKTWENVSPAFLRGFIDNFNDILRKMKI